MSSQRLAFIHIPKTGGTYVGRLKASWNLRYLGHACVVDLSQKNAFPYVQTGIDRTVSYQEINKYYAFAIVRNIFEWLVSYAGHAGGWNPDYRDLNHYDYKNAQKGFEYLVKTISDRDSSVWPNRKLIFFQLFCNNGRFCVDRLLRTETLDADLSILASDFGVPYQIVLKQRVGKHKDYRKYYNDPLIELVQNTWRKELKLFGYTFDSFDKSNVLFNKTIDKILYFYDHNQDVLIVN